MECIFIQIFCRYGLLNCPVLHLITYIPKDQFKICLNPIILFDHFLVIHTCIQCFQVLYNHWAIGVNFSLHPTADIASFGAGCSKTVGIANTCLFIHVFLPFCAACCFINCCTLCCSFYNSSKTYRICVPNKNN